MCGGSRENKGNKGLDVPCVVEVKAPLHVYMKGELIMKDLESRLVSL